MYEQQETNHGLHMASVLVGVAAGIAGTILYATYREREFNRIVGKTREISDNSSQYIGDVGHNLKERAVALVDSAEHAVSNISQSVHNLADKKQPSTN